MERFQIDENILNGPTSVFLWTSLPLRFIRGIHISQVGRFQETLAKLEIVFSPLAAPSLLNRAQVAEHQASLSSSPSTFLHQYNILIRFPLCSPYKKCDIYDHRLHLWKRSCCLSKLQLLCYAESPI